MSSIGHNSGASMDKGHLMSFIERIERLEDDRKAIVTDIGEVYSEAKGTGYNAKILRKIVAMRRQDQDKLQRENEELEAYLDAIGMEV